MRVVYGGGQVERLMLDGSKKLPNTMRDAIAFLTENGHATTYLGLAVAAYIRYVTGVDDEGQDLQEVLDPNAKVNTREMMMRGGTRSTDEA
jgi:mannitol-1-phosphate/altronate dehydrogenase